MKCGLGYTGLVVILMVFRYFIYSLWLLSSFTFDTLLILTILPITKLHKSHHFILTTPPQIINPLHIIIEEKKSQENNILHIFLLPSKLLDLVAGKELCFH